MTPLPKTSYAREHYPAGAAIFREGEPGDCAYIIDRGRVELSALRNGKCHVLAEAAEGDLFGELVLIDDDVRSATAVALTDVTLILISREHVSEKMSLSDPIIKLFLRIIVDRFRETRARDDMYVQKNEHDSTQSREVDKPFNQTLARDRELTIARLRLEDDLHRALEQEELCLYYQPILDLKTGHIAGFEALMRWKHPEKGLLTPDNFIPLAEQTGVIVPIGIWLLREACQAVQRFQHEHGQRWPDAPPLFISINVSARQLDDPSVYEKFAYIVKRSGIEPSSLKLEITENLLMQNPELASAVLNQFKNTGMKLAIDDFGTGYSSLSYLHRFPMDTLKIDQSFVRTMLESEDSMAIVRTIAELALNLGMKIIAEGMESAEQMSCLREFNCDYGQGYLISKPLPEPKAVKLLGLEYV